MQDVGRNDPCPCGSGKKFKQCCMKQTSSSSAPQRQLKKISAKIIQSGNTPSMPTPSASQQQEQQKAVADYVALMERAYGTSLRLYPHQPPAPESPDQYLKQP